VLEEPRSGDAAILGNVAHDHDRRAMAAFGKTHQRGGTFAQLHRRAGTGLDRLEPHRLDRIDHQQCAAPLGGNLQDGVERAIGDQFEVCAGQFEALGAQRHLRHGFLPARIDDRQILREGRGDLQKQGRFADSRLAAQQRDRARQQPAAKYPIELRETQRHARLRAGRQACGLEARALRGGSAHRISPRRADAFERIPGLAVRALALPFEGFTTAVAAHEQGLATSHEYECAQG
jgi:hypothetical protein